MNAYRCAIADGLVFGVDADERALARISRDMSWLTACDAAPTASFKLRRTRGTLDAARVQMAQGLDRWGKSTFCDGRTVVRQFWDWCLLKIGPGGVEVLVREFAEPAALSWLRPWLGKPGVEGMNAQRETYALRMGLHYPLFHSLARRNKGVLHGSAVEKDGKCVVLAGFDGAGKSTLALYLCEKKGWSMAADNFVVYDDAGGVYPMLEATRLRDDSRAAVGLSGGEAVMGRSQLSTARHSTKQRRLPATAVLHTVIAKASGLEELSVEQLRDRVLAMTESVSEFLDLKAYRSTASLVCGGLSPGADADTLGRFLGKTRCRQLSLDGLEGLEKQAALVEHVL